MSKKVWLFLGVCLVSLLGSVQAEEREEAQRTEFNIFEKQYRLSTVFEMDAHGKPFGTVVKSVFRIRTNYDVYDAQGVRRATGICRLLCLGSFAVWGTEIDVYDTEGNYLGFIDGQAATLESAKFSIYDKEGDRVGIAYMDLTNAGFSILHPEKETSLFVRLTRKFVQDQIDSWKIDVYDDKAIHPDVIKVFAAFAIDRQEFFKEDK